MSSMNNRQLFFQHLAQTSGKPIGIEVASAEGIYIKDVNGKKFVDMIAGLVFAILDIVIPKSLRLFSSRLKSICM